MNGFQRAMALSFAEQRRSWQVHFGAQIDVSRLAALRAQYRDRGEDPPSYTTLLIKAIALSIREIERIYPEINTMLTGLGPFRRARSFDRISGSVAVAREEPEGERVAIGVVPDPDTAELGEINRLMTLFATEQLAKIPDMNNCITFYKSPWPLQWLISKVGGRFVELQRRYRGTFAITSVGKFGVDWQLSLPQLAPLQFGFGYIADRPIARDGQVAVAPTMNLSMCFNRILINGRPAALLLDRIRRRLETADMGAATSEDAQQSA